VLVLADASTAREQLVTDLVAQLQELYRDKLTALLRHQIAAQSVGQYDANNTYQYILNREETHLSWIAAAIAELGGTVPDTVDPNRRVSDRGTGETAARTVIEEDGRDAQALVDKWQFKLPTIANARHAKMIRLILGGMGSETTVKVATELVAVKIPAGEVPAESTTNLNCLPLSFVDAERIV